MPLRERADAAVRARGRRSRAVSSVERIPDWRLRRMTPAQRHAVDRLRWHNEAPAKRARLKRTLGLQPTREETLALLRELRDRRMVRSAILAELGCSERHLRWLLAEVQDLENGARKPAPQLEQTDITGNGKGAGRPGRADITGNGRRAPIPHPDPGRIVYAGDPFAYDLEAALGRASAR
jgi:hypothetical protein